MKVHTKVVIDLNTGAVLEDEWHEYAGPVAEAKGKGSEPQQTVQTNDPWSGQQPYLRQLFSEASRLYGGGAPSQPSGQTYGGGGGGWNGSGWAGSVNPFGSTGGSTGPSYNGIGYDRNALNSAMQQHVEGLDFGGLQAFAAPGASDAWATDWIQRNGTAGSGTGTGAAPSSVIPFSPETESALQRQTQMSQTSPVSSSLDATIRGDYLYGNPGFDAAYQASANKIIPQVNSMFATAGRSGSGLAQGEMAGRLGDSFAGLYNNERNRQMQGLSMAPSVRYNDVDRLAAVGEQREGLQREYAMEPWDRLSRYGSFLGGNYGGTTTTSQPLYRNKTAGALGGAVIGGGLASSLAMSNPWTAGLAIGGGLLGMM